MTICPQCQRHLLSQASARCNWCGATINDAAYQANAQTEREAYFRHAAAHDAQSLAAAEAIALLSTPMDPFTRTPMPGHRRVSLAAQTLAAHSAPNGTSARMPKREPQPPQANAGQTTTGSDAPSEAIKNEAEAAGDRFRHLEL